MRASPNSKAVFIFIFPFGCVFMVLNIGSTLSKGVPVFPKQNKQIKGHNCITYCGSYFTKVLFAYKEQI